MVTVKDIKQLFTTTNVRQFDSKQLFIVDGQLLVSYKTVIGWYNYKTQQWHVTNKYYSRTTSGHISYFMKKNSPVIREEIIEDINHYI